MHNKATLKWPTIAKGHNSNKLSLNWLKILPGDLLLSPNQYTKYQDSSSNTFWDILLTRFQCYFIKRAITLKWKKIRIRNKKKYRSPIFSWWIHIWNFKTLAYMVIKICYAQESMTNEQTNERMNGQARSNMSPNFLKAEGIKIKNYLLLA